MFPTPGQQALSESRRNVEAYGETDRFWCLNRLEAFYNGQQYDGLPSFWDTSVPLRERAPYIQSQFTRAAVDRVAHLVFGRRRFPRFAVQSSAYGVTLTDVERVALNALVKELVEVGRLSTFALAYLKEGLKTRAACAVPGLAAGRPVAPILPAKWCHPTFDATGAVTRLVIEYKHALDGELHWHHREIDATGDRTWAPVKVDPRRAPQWAALRPSATIDLPFCPVVWTKNLPPATASASDPDGVALIDGLEDEIVALDRDLSQLDRYALFNGDTQIIRKGAFDGSGTASAPQGRAASANADPAHQTVFARFQDAWRGLTGATAPATKKAPGSIWDVPATGAVEYLESTGAGANIFASVIKELRRTLGDSTGVLLADPEMLGRGDLSARALTVLHAPMLDLADVLTADYGPALCRVLNAWLRLVARDPARAHLATAQDPVVQRALRRFVSKDEDGREAWIPVPLALAWGAYFEPSPGEVRDRIDAAQRGNGNRPVLSQRAAVSFVASAVNVEDVDAEVSAIEQEETASRGVVTDALTRLAAPDAADAKPADDAPEVTIEPATEAPTAPEGVAKAADAALNGAQVASLVNIVTAVAAGTLPRDSARAIVRRAFLVNDLEAEEILGSAGRGFVPRPSTPETP